MISFSFQKVQIWQASYLQRVKLGAVEAMFHSCNLLSARFDWVTLGVL